MKSTAVQIAILGSLAAASLSYSVPSSYQAQYNDAVNRQNRAKNIAISDARPVLSSACLAHTSAVISGIDIHEASESKGLGAFATAPIKRGTYLGEYSGESMTLNEVRARFWGKRDPDAADLAWAASRRKRNQGMSGNYIFELKDGTFICAEDGEQSTWTRFMNHVGSDYPACNVKPFMQTERNGDVHRYPRFYAIRDIEAGEELQYDYGDQFYSDQGSL